MYLGGIWQQKFRAHAALSPWEGTNALDAAVLAYNNISALRQQLKPTHRVHGVFEGKDWAPNSLSWFSNYRLIAWRTLKLFLILPNSCRYCHFIPMNVLTAPQVLRSCPYACRNGRNCEKSHPLFWVSYLSRITIFVCKVWRAAALATGCQISFNVDSCTVFDLRQNEALGNYLHMS